MKKIQFLFLTAFFTITFLNLVAQQSVEVKWGTTNTVETNAKIIKIIGKDDNGFFALRKKSQVYKATYYIERYDNEMNIKFQKELELPVVGKETSSFQDIVYIKGNIILFTSRANKAAKTYFLYASTVSKDGLVDSSPKKLGETNTFLHEGVDIAFSKDSTKFVVSDFVSVNSMKYLKSKFNFKCYDLSLNIIWEKELQFPYQEKWLHLNNCKIDNDGNLYLTVRAYEGKKAFEDSETKKLINLFKYNYKEDKLTQLESGFEGDWMESLFYTLNENTDEILLTGFYKDDSKTGIKGIFWSKVNLKTGNLIHYSKQQFSKKIMAEIIGEKKAEKGKGFYNGLMGYTEITDNLLKSNGGSYIIAQERKKPYAPGVIEYTYGNLLVLSVEKEGKIEWGKQILRSESIEKGSYLIKNKKNSDDFDLIFNDHPENIEYLKSNPNEAKKGPYTKANLVSINITNLGVKPREEIMSNNELGEFYMNPKAVMQISENKFMVGFRNSDKFKFATISFK